MMFEGLEHKPTAEERRSLTLEVVGAVVACAAIGGVIFWFFRYFSEY